MFWKHKTLQDMTQEEWESLCDHCGICCLKKIKDFNGKDHQYTSIACRFLNTNTGDCILYGSRLENCEDCMVLTPDKVAEFSWLPETCAYRRVHEGKDLPSWHPLITGDPQTVHHSGVSVKGKAIPEEYTAAAEIEDFVCSFDNDGKIICALEEE